MLRRQPDGNSCPRIVRQAHSIRFDLGQCSKALLTNEFWRAPLRKRSRSGDPRRARRLRSDVEAACGRDLQRGPRFVLTRLPAPLHRLLYRVAHWARRPVWNMWQPTVSGVRVLALDDRAQVLLIRHSYGSRKWMLPGGGLRRDETSVAHAVREP